MHACVHIYKNSVWMIVNLYHFMRIYVCNPVYYLTVIDLFLDPFDILQPYIKKTIEFLFFLVFLFLYAWSSAFVKRWQTKEKTKVHSNYRWTSWPDWYSVKSVKVSNNLDKKQ